MTPENVELFHCTQRKLTLTRAGCARLHSSCGRDRPKPWEGRHGCMFCATGAENRRHLAGLPEPPIFIAALPWRSTCGRCLRKSDRIIHKSLCVSCYNRDREARLGHNAKGGRPMLCDQLRPQVIVVAEEGRVRQVRQDLATGALELMLGVIKAVSGPVAFGWGNAHV